MPKSKNTLPQIAKQTYVAIQTKNVGARVGILVEHDDGRITKISGRVREWMMDLNSDVFEVGGDYVPRFEASTHVHIDLHLGYFLGDFETVDPVR